MASEELEEIRNLFERSEKEPLIRQKLLLLEDALAALVDFASDSSPQERNIAINIHNSYLRRIILQITDVRRLESSQFFKCVRLLYFRADPYTREFVSTNADMQAAIEAFEERYQGFVRGP